MFDWISAITTVVAPATGLSFLNELYGTNNENTGQAAPPNTDQQQLGPTEEQEQLAPVIGDQKDDDTDFPGGLLSLRINPSLASGASQSAGLQTRPSFALMNALSQGK